MESDERYLEHHGILGMHWGHHKSYNDLGIKTLSKSKTSNLDKWGRDANYNILYITGYSGSGKSTIALSLGKKNTNIIHLDGFFEKMSKSVTSSIQDKEFVSYLKKNFPEYTRITNSTGGNRHTQQWWHDVDNLMDHTEKFASQQFKKNKKVIVEGVQLHDETTYPDKNFFKDKPLIITGTNPMSSFFRASQRDDRPLFTSIESSKQYIKWYADSYKTINNLSKITNAKKKVVTI